MFRWLRSNAPRPVAKAKKKKQPIGTVQMERFLNAAQPELVQWLDKTWADQQKAITYQALTEAIQAGTLSASYIEQWQQDYSKLVTQIIAPSWESAIQDAAAHVTEKYGEFVIDMAAPNVDNWIKAHGAEFVTNTALEQRSAIQSMLRRAATAYDDFGVDELARAIRPTIGLTDRQSQAALNLYTQARENGATVQQARDAQARYAARMHRNRAQIIADYELTTAYNRGNQMAVEQLQELGEIGNVTKTWSTDATESVCEVCGALDGVTVPINEDFPITAAGMFHKDLPPIHPHCHCCVKYNISPPDGSEGDEMTLDGEPAPPDPIAPPQPPEPEPPTVPDTIVPQGLTFDKKLDIGNTGEMYQFTDADGQEWYFKPANSKGGTYEPFRAHVQEAAYKVQGLIDPDSAVSVTTMELDIPGKGKRFGALQRKVDIMPPADALAEWQDHGGQFDQAFAQQLQRENVTDWLLANYDASGKNFVFDSNVRIIGIDKEQSFRYLGKAGTEKMSYSFHPNAVYHETEPVYNTMYRRFAKNELDLNLQDTLTYLKRVEAIPDTEYREIFRTYAESLKGKGKAAEELLDQIVERKQGARAAFEEFYDGLMKERLGQKAGFQFLDTIAQAAAPQPVQAAVLSQQSLGKMTLADLKQLAKNQKVPYYANMYKSDLITALSDPSQVEALSALTKTRLSQQRAAREILAKPTPAVSHSGVPSLSKALEDFDQVIAHGNTTGVAMMSDSTALEGLETYLKRVTINGETAYELSGKLTTGRWQQALKDLEQRGGLIKTNMGFLRSSVDYDNGLINYAGSYMRNGTNIPILMADDAGNVFIMTRQLAETEARSFMGSFSVRIKAADGREAARQASELLKKFGLDDIVKDTTVSDIDALKKARLIWQKDASLADSVASGRIKLDEAVNRLGITKADLDNLEFRRLNDGYFTLAKKAADKVVDEQVAYLWCGVGDIDGAASIVQSKQLMSTNYRWTQGLMGSTGSPTADIGTGGADHVFTRMALKKDIGAHKYDDSLFSGQARFIIDKAELQRTDWYAYDSDTFGSTKSGPFLTRRSVEDHVAALSRRYCSSNETMFRKMVPMESITEIRVNNAQARQQLIDNLKRRGIHEINGTTVEKFIKIGNKL